MDDDTRELVAKLGKRFLSRNDVKAIQNPDGTWRPDRTTIKMSDFRMHLEGKRTIGHYMLSPDGNVKLFAFDIDIKKNSEKNETFYRDNNNEIVLGDMRAAWTTPNHAALPFLRTQLRCMAEGLAYAIHRLTDGKLHVAVLDSGGKGLHVYGFFDAPVPAQVARDTAMYVLEDLRCFEPVRGNNFWRHVGVTDSLDQVTQPYQNLEIEIFPKQTSLVGKDLGNLMRLPLGVNAKTGRVSQFLRLDNGYEDEWNVLPPLDALGGTLPWPKS